MTYITNNTYFDNIDTEDKAYFLGLIYADGCNDIPNNRLIITLIHTDGYLLERLNSLVNINRKVTVVKERHRKYKNGK